MCASHEPLCKMFSNVDSLFWASHIILLIQAWHALTTWVRAKQRDRGEEKMRWMFIFRLTECMHTEWMRYMTECVSFLGHGWISNECMHQHHWRTETHRIINKWFIFWRKHNFPQISILASVNFSGGPVGSHFRRRWSLVIRQFST